MLQGMLFPPGFTIWPEDVYCTQANGGANTPRFSAGSLRRPSATAGDRSESRVLAAGGSRQHDLARVIHVDAPVE